MISWLDVRVRASGKYVQDFWSLSGHEMARMGCANFQIRGESMFTDGVVFFIIYLIFNI